MPLDLSAASDAVDHDILVRQVLSGVPHGSLLGPPLFVYMWETLAELSSRMGWIHMPMQTTVKSIPPAIHLRPSDFESE